MADNFGLTQAAGSGHFKKVNQLLKDGADANFRHENFHRWTPIVWAAFSINKHGDKAQSIIDDLLNHGADINAAHNDMGYNAVNAAALRENISLVKKLVEKGGDIDHAVLSLRRSKDQLKIFDFLKNHFELKVTCEELENLGVKEAIISAAKNSHLKKLAKLLKNVETLDFTYDGFSPLTAAGYVHDYNFEGMTLILEAGANIDYFVNKSPYEKPGVTALMLAIDRDYTKVANFLLDQGANTFIKDGLGHTAIDYARKRADMNSTKSDMMERQIELIEKIKAIQEQSVLNKTLNSEAPMGRC